MSQQLAFETKLSKRDFFVYTKLWVYLRLEVDAKKATGEECDGAFCVDDLRAYGLDRFFRDPEHDLGAFFLRLKVNALVEDVGDCYSLFASNNGRRIRRYRMRGWNQ